MSQMGFFNLSDCLDRLDDKQDALILINKAVPWEEFRPILEKIWRKDDVQRKSRAGRKPTDAGQGQDRDEELDLQYATILPL